MVGFKERIYGQGSNESKVAPVREMDRTGPFHCQFAIFGAASLHFSRFKTAVF